MEEGEVQDLRLVLEASGGLEEEVLEVQVHSIGGGPGG